MKPFAVPLGINRRALLSAPAFLSIPALLRVTSALGKTQVVNCLRGTTDPLNRPSSTSYTPRPTDRASPKFVPLEELIATTGMSVEVFEAEAKKWIETAKHPRWKRLYTDLTYQPMLEVLQYLRANGYRTYIVTGGGQDFVRVYSQQVYGIPPEQVVARPAAQSTVTTRTASRS